MEVVGEGNGMRPLLKRLRWFLLALIGVVAIMFVASALAPQRVIPMKSHATVSVSDIEGGPLRLTPIQPDRLVFLELLDYGYSPPSGGADELSYDRFSLGSGGLCRSEYYDRYKVLPPRYRGFPSVSGPLVITERTKIAMNVDRSNTALNAAAIPVIVNKVPWRYDSYGTPFIATPDTSRPGWLRHSLTITEVADDGSVVLTAGRWRVLLRPGGEVTVERSLGWWASAVRIRNCGVVLKSRITPSAGLRVRNQPGA